MSKRSRRNKSRKTTHKKSAINTSADLLEALVLGEDYSSSGGVSNNNAMRQAAVFQCVRVLAESIGPLPMGLFKKDGKERHPARDHSVHSVISLRPNGYQTATEFWEMCMVHLGYRGNFYAHIVRAGDRVMELIPYNPDVIEPSLSDDYEMTYKRRFLDGRPTVTLDAKDVFHVKIFSIDGIVGLNPVEYARTAIGMGKSLESHGSRLFQKGAQPGGVLSTDARIEQKDAEEMADRFEERHGNGNKGKTAVLGNGLKYQPIAINNTDAEWLGARQFQKSDIAGFYRVPPHMINDLTRSTNNNIEHQGLEFVRQTLLPYAVKIEQRCAVSLLTPQEVADGYYVKLNFKGLLRGDMESRSEFYKTLSGTGAINSNEIRELEDMNPREGGDVYLTPINMAHDGVSLATGKEKGNNA